MVPDAPTVGHSQPVQTSEVWGAMQTNLAIAHAKHHDCDQSAPPCSTGYCRVLSYVRPFSKAREITLTLDGDEPNTPGHSDHGDLA